MNGHNVGVLNKKRLASLCAALVASGVLFLPGGAIGQNVIMNDAGSTATLNLGGGTGDLGMNGWNVGTGGNQLVQQWFWYSIGVGNVAQSIDTISPANVQTANGSDGINTVVSTYANSQLKVQIEYVLSGNGVGSGSADIQEFVSIMNVGTSQFTLNFYQYSNFNLLMNNNNVVSISGNPSSGFSGAVQTTGGPGGSGLAEVVDAPYANYAEAALAGVTLSELMAGPYTLNDNTGPVTGDVSWAFEWNDTINPGDTLYITKDKGLSIQIVPEPSTVALIALGLGACGLARRRQSS